MKGILGVALAIFILTGCALNPPKPQKAKGEWSYIVTTPADLRNI